MGLLRRERYFFAGRHCQFDRGIFDVVIQPHLRQVTENDRARVDGLLRLQCGMATRRRGIRFREKSVPFGVGLTLPIAPSPRLGLMV